MADEGIMTNTPLRCVRHETVRMGNDGTRTFHKTPTY